MIDNDLVIDILLALGFVLAAPMVCCCLVACCLSHMENSLKDRNTDTESTENITRRNTRSDAVIQLPDAIRPEILYEETQADPSIARPRNYQQSLSVSLHPEIILTPSQHVINQECDSPPSYESLFTCECSGRPSPNSGGSNLNLTFDSGWSIVDSVNWVFRKIEDSFIWIFDQMDQHM